MKARSSMGRNFIEVEIFVACWILQPNEFFPTSWSRLSGFRKVFCFWKRFASSFWICNLSLISYQCISLICYYFLGLQVRWMGRCRICQSLDHGNHQQQLVHDDSSCCRSQNCANCLFWNWRNRKRFLVRTVWKVRKKKKEKKRSFLFFVLILFILFQDINLQQLLMSWCKNGSPPTCFQNVTSTEKWKR